MPNPSEAHGEQATAAESSVGTVVRDVDQKREPRKEQSLLAIRKEQIEALSEGVFRPWNRSPMGWVLGGGAMLALVDLWVRWWTISL